MTDSTPNSRYRPYGASSLDELRQRFNLDSRLVHGMKIAARVFPMRVNEYVVTHLIDWAAVPDDPIFRLVFPMTDMLADEDRRLLDQLDVRQAPPSEWGPVVARIRADMNPHPSNQMTTNAPLATLERPGGLQHKYPETVLFFPTEGQTCHAYCTFCFRWPQFVGDRALRFAEHDPSVLVDYLKAHDEVRDVLFTGGDPLMMRSRQLTRYLDAVCQPEVDSVDTVRIGTKALTYWPYRVLRDPDADELLRGLERVARRRNLVIVAHVTHPQELVPDEAIEAIRRVRSAGAAVYCQGPLVRHVNDSSRIWHDLLTTEVRLGCVPYYMFMERDTGARRYFEVPIVEAVTIFRDAYLRLPGLARTVRGPVMSTDPGKVLVDGETTLGGERVLSLRFVQARTRDWLLRPFHAVFDPSATWFDQLRPAGGEDRFFFDGEDVADVEDPRRPSGRGRWAASS